MKPLLHALPLLALIVPGAATGQSRRASRPPRTPVVPVAPAPAQPGPAARELARLHFVRGVERADARRWRDAIGEFEQARALAASPAVYFNLASAYQSVGRRVDALAAYEAFVQHAGTELSESRAREVSVQIALLRAQVAHLDLQLAPDSAEAMLDEIAVVRSTGPIDVDPGRHQLTVVSPGYATTTRTLSLAAGATLRVRIALPANSEAGRLFVEATPSDAMIRIDGQDISQGRAEEPLTMGLHQLEVTAPQHRAFRRALTIRPGIDLRMRAMLEDQRPLVQRPWFWAVGGTVAVGLALGLGLGLGLRQEPAFHGELPNAQAIRWQP